MNSAAVKLAARAPRARMYRGTFHGGVHGVSGVRRPSPARLRGRSAPLAYATPGDGAHRAATAMQRAADIRTFASPRDNYDSSSYKDNGQTFYMRP